MRTLFGLLPAAACAGGMYLCMRMMSRGHRSQAGPGTPDRPTTPASAEEVAELREEVRRLRAEAQARDPQSP